MEILGFSLTSWAVFLCFVYFLSFLYDLWRLKFFRNQGLQTTAPLPMILGVLVCVKMGLTNIDKTITSAYGKVFGGLVMGSLQLYVADVDIIRQIQIKQFHNFRNHQNMSIFMDRPLDKLVFSLKDDQWKHVRSKLSPTFSSGKMRRMDALVNMCAKQLVETLQEKAERSETFNAIETIGAYSTDVIGTTAFGLDTNSQKEPNSPFVRHGKSIFNFDSSNPRMWLFFFPPLFYVCRKLGYSIIPKESLQSFERVVDKALASRTVTDKATRTDFLQLMVNAHREEEGDSEGDMTSNQGLTHEEVMGQAVGFFAAGFNTVAHAMTFLLYILAVHPEVQDKILQEIQMTLEGSEEVNYDSLNKMQYLDLVIQETLRMYTPGNGRINRECNQDTEIKGIRIPKGMVVNILVQALHYDPVAWPDPEKFDPERFTPENKATRDSLYWQPFGTGPRQCVGMQLALMEIKVAAVHIVKNFVVRTCAKTQIPIQREGLNGTPLTCFLQVEKRVS